ncbi:MAG: tetratricopeptide repeat protein [Reichenbachiella sp.]
MKKEGESGPKLENCMTTYLLDYEDKLVAVYGSTYFENEQNAQQLGIDIVKIMTKICPSFMVEIIEQELNEDKNAENLIAKAKEEKEAGNTDAAIALFGQAIEMGSDNPEEVLNDRGITYYGMGDYYRAISDFLRAMEVEPENYTYYYNIAYSLYQLSDANEAIKYIDQAMERKSQYCEAYNLKGLIYDNQNSMDSSLYYFKKASDCDPKDGVKGYNVGYAYYELEEYESAIGWFELALEREYESADLYNYLGNAHFGLQNYKEALPFYEKHLEYNEENYVSYYNIGTCHYMLKSYDQAIEWLDKANKFEADDYDITFYLAKSYLRKDDLKKSLKYVNESIALKSTKADYYDFRAAIYNEQEEYELALMDYGTSIRLYPNDCQVHQFMGDAYQQLGRTEAAEQAYKKSKKMGCE